MERQVSGWSEALSAIGSRWEKANADKARITELERILGRKTLEIEILK
ncbi:MAG: hypothetical protein H0Z29_11710 [Candidatus Marinimicrobia bacterium]|nr:hypothetical protein [Candidatus Neomarinimicrobiota bacterium]